MTILVHVLIVAAALFPYYKWYNSHNKLKIVSDDFTQLSKALSQNHALSDHLKELLSQERDKYNTAKNEELELKEKIKFLEKDNELLKNIAEIPVNNQYEHRYKHLESELKNFLEQTEDSSTILNKQNPLRKQVFQIMRNSIIRILDSAQN